MSELFAPLPAFETAFPISDGLTIEERSGIGLATVMIRKDQSAALVKRVRSLYGINLPASPSRAGTDDLAFIGIGPGVWLAAGSSSSGFTSMLANDLEGLASVSDQSSGYAVLRLSGPKARTLLQKGVPIDLHPSVFRPEKAAVTVIAHIGCMLWQTDEGAFEVAVFRSMAGSFHHWLAASAAI
ncbi:sarcosine oxidase subunit gamma [Flaviflagellibacter deserti]|uniref:Sarcosine oxidase subunit gamma n=1 Tax=Flaviflagellibacter deserti TaxID=2267266 RepID=A0ABV9Z480_9HYPH